MTVSSGTTNGDNTNGPRSRSSHAGTCRPLSAGIYAPLMTFFDPVTEELDITSIKKHAERLARAGLAGLVTMGSNGEAAHCTRDERLAVTKATREALDEAGFKSIPIIFGATEGSVKGTIELSKMAAAVGADSILVLPPSYYRSQMDEEAVCNYFIDLADASPLPIVLYNYPGAAAGVDMDSDLLIRLAKHPNIIGTKFTCGNTGKLTRVASATKGTNYMAFGGFVDFIVQTLVSGGSGIIGGGVNVMPKACVRVWNLYVEGKNDEAQDLQKIISRCDWVLTKSAIAGTKSAIQSYYGYGGYPRRPLRRLSSEQAREIEGGIREIMEIEKSL